MRKGFSISAIGADGQGWQTYTEATSTREIIMKTLDEFPEAEGWHSHELTPIGEGGRKEEQFTVQITADVKAAIGIN